MTPQVRIVLLAAAAVLLLAGAGWIIRLKRRTPAEKERRRRLLVNRLGRLTDGMITDFSEETIYYTYSVMGVGYSNSQSIKELGGQLPAQPASLVGPVMLKYLPRNPANSIVICEEWTGLRPGHQTPNLTRIEGEQPK